MTEHSKNSNEFTAQDIERYYSGKMSSLEMHMLEKAAMEDPFLADALEGYGYTNTHIKDNEDLHSRLQSKMIAGKIEPINKFDKNQFLKIAALFILLAGCGWAVYHFAFNTRNNDIASAKKIETSAPPSPAKSPDTIKNVEVQQKITNSETDIQTTTIQGNGNGSVSLSTQNRHTVKPNSSTTSIRKEKVENNVAPQGETETVTSGYNKDATAATPGISVTSDSGTVASAPPTVSAGKENVVVLKRTNSNPPEVVLSNIKKDSNYRKPKITFEEAEPANGSVYYNDYVLNNLEMPEFEMRKNVTGEVKLSFDVNEAGQAVNIKVEKSLCTGCDKEAIRLLKDGPKWVKKKTRKKGKLSIKF